MATGQIIPAFFWGSGGARLTPEEIAQQRQVLNALQGQTDTSPVGHWSQGAARVVDALGGVLKERRLDKAGKANAADAARIRESLLGGLGGVPAAAPASAPVAVAPVAVGAASAAPVTGGNADYIRAGLVQRGLPEHVADGFVLNMKDESGLNPGINEAAPTVAGSRGGFGLYQLTGPRRVAYESFANERGVAPSDVDAQLDFLVSELKGPEAKAAQSILAAPDTGTAAAAIVNDFLRPAESHRARREAEYLQAATRPSQASLEALPVGGVAPMQAAPVQVAQSGGINPAILEALSSPYADEGTKRIAASLFGQQQENQTWQQRQQYEQQARQADPGYQLDMQYKQAQMDALRAKPTVPLTDDQREYQAAKDEGFKGGLQDWITLGKRAGAASTNVTIGEGNKFYEKLDEKNAELFSTLSSQGVEAQSKAAQIDQLDSLLSAAPSGATAILKQAAGEYGIKTEGLSDIQAAQALINQMVPTQRLPGSGTMSDADLALFKASLPRLLNTPEGNKTIIQTMRGMTEYQRKMGEIADSVANRELSPEDGRRALKEIPNPLAGFKPSTATPSAPAPAESPAQAKRVDDLIIKRFGKPFSDMSVEELKAARKQLEPSRGR
jgi:hypothetical protein